jgi:hypothetical protein|tara:strand:- start:9121 stop:9720 length:600 start_codon:yes stop_codon:yes gene_type:complete
MTPDEFYNKIPDWISQDKDRWNHITLMAYFCHKYEEKNGSRFRLVRWKSDPGKGKESADFAKLFSIFSPDNYKGLSGDEKRESRVLVNKKIYNYINWMFDYKFRSGDRSVTGTRIFLLPAVINEFERMYSNYLIKKSRDNSISILIGWCKANTPDIFDRQQLEDIDDLNLMIKYVETYNLSNKDSECLVLLKAKEMGII